MGRAAATAPDRTVSQRRPPGRNPAKIQGINPSAYLFATGNASLPAGQLKHKSHRERTRKGSANICKVRASGQNQRLQNAQNSQRQISTGGVRQLHAGTSATWASYNLTMVPTTAMPLVLPAIPKPVGCWSNCSQTERGQTSC
eukprot:358811-Chlamydomonas_euryale.AAC.9